MWRKRSSDHEKEKKMTLVEHLAELRKRIIYSALFFLVSSVLCYSYSKVIIKEIVDIVKDVDFIFIAPAELLLSYIKLSLIGGLIISSPFIIFQIWLFVKPGLNKGERRKLLLSLITGSVFFISGAIFAYFVVIPIALVFFMGFQTREITPMISFNNYLSFILSTVFTFGIVFEVPIIMVLLTRFGIVKVSFLKKSRKYIILIIFILSAILTPPDVVSQMLLSGPLIILTEIGIFLSNLMKKSEK